MGKSAQLGPAHLAARRHGGPDAGLALIHAATMVTAGVFMVARLSPLFERADVALTVVTFVGANDRLLRGDHRLRAERHQAGDRLFDLQPARLHVLRLGVSAYSAGIFHLMTHAFFKALLFLGAGSVIHAMSDEQDMRRKWAGSGRLIPVTYVMMWIGSLALAGIWPFAGFFSKDIVLEAAWGAHTFVGQYAFWLGILAAFLTAFYSWRLLLMTFHGEPRGPTKVTMAHVHESPKVMLIPLGGIGDRRHLRRLARLRLDFVGEDRGVLGQLDLCSRKPQGARKRAPRRRCGSSSCRWSSRYPASLSPT